MIRSTLPLGAKLRDGMTVRIVRVDVDQVRRGFLIDRRTECANQHSSMYEGSEKVLKDGRDGRGVERSTDWSVATESSLNENWSSARSFGSHRHAWSPTEPRHVPLHSTDHRFVRLELGGVGAVRVGRQSASDQLGGYYGLYQFALSTWYSVGGGPGNPIDASPPSRPIVPRCCTAAPVLLLGRSAARCCS